MIDYRAVVDCRMILPNGRGQHLECEERGCYNTTKQGKPYCLAHLRLMPYIAQQDGLPIHGK